MERKKVLAKGGRKKVLEEEGTEEGFREREMKEGVEDDYEVKLTSDGIFLLL